MTPDGTKDSLAMLIAEADAALATYLGSPLAEFRIARLERPAADDSWERIASYPPATITK